MVIEPEPRGTSREGLYVLLFASQWALCLVGIAWQEIGYETGDTWLETVIAIGKGMQAAAVLVAAWTITIMEGGYMLYERYARRRFESGKAEGRQEGRQEERQEWDTWNTRRIQAERRGQPFDEPPPSERNGPAR